MGGPQLPSLGNCGRPAKHNDPQLDGCGSLQNLAASTFLLAASTRYPHAGTHVHTHGHGADAAADIGSGEHAWLLSIAAEWPMSSRSARRVALQLDQLWRCLVTKDKVPQGSRLSTLTWGLDLA